MIFIDVRRDAEYSAGHCSKAKNIVWNSDACWKNGKSDPACKAFIDELKATVNNDYTKPIFVHCVSGNRAGQVAKYLQGLSWTNNKLSPPVTYTSDYTGTKFTNFVVSNGGFADICSETSLGSYVAAPTSTENKGLKDGEVIGICIAVVVVALAAVAILGAIKNKDANKKKAPPASGTPTSSKEVEFALEAGSRGQA
jgi:rhodanese-related sulfurtransferase